MNIHLYKNDLKCNKSLLLCFARTCTYKLIYQKNKSVFCLNAHGFEQNFCFQNPIYAAPNWKRSKLKLFVIVR